MNDELGRSRHFMPSVDDTNVFYSNSSIDEIERVMNEELNHIFQYCMINKLSINYNKTNYMLLKPSNKETRHIIINNIEVKAYIKYLGIYIDNNFKWTQQINHVASKIAKNTGILNKLRYYIDLKQLKQLYYSLIYPYLNYGLMGWGNTYTSSLNKIRSGQNTCVKNMFFASKRENATPYYNLLNILKFDNIFKLKISIFTYEIINDKSAVPTVFSQIIQLASACHSYNTRFAGAQNFNRPKVRTNYGIHTFNFVSSQLWQSIDLEIKLSNSVSIFKKRYAQYLLFSQV